MGIALRRLSPHGVNLFVFHGRIDRDEFIGFYRGIVAEESVDALPWLTYVAPDTDLMEVDLAAFAEVRRIIAPIRQHVEQRNPFLSVVVSGSARSDPLVYFWRDFVAKESSRPPYTVLFRDIEQACRELNLPDTAPEAIIAAIQSVVPLDLTLAQGEGAQPKPADLRSQKALESELRAAVAEKEMLYRELAHRAKTHLDIMSGLLKLEARDASTAAEMAERMSVRLKLLAGIYDRIIEAQISGRVPAGAFLEHVVSLYRTGSVSIDVTAPEGLTLEPGAAGPFGMLVNEAVANSYKHAFPDRSGRIEVTLRANAPGRLELTIADDGVGLMASTDRPSRGLKLMRLLAQQLGGELETSDRKGGGAQVVVNLPDLSEPVQPDERPRPQSGDA